MSEERFERWNDYSCKVKDNQEDTFLNWEDVVDLLNEQQATINKQLDQIIELQDKYRILEFNHSRLEKRNKAQCKKISDQQATISALKKENEKLKSENKKLEQQYHNLVNAIVKTYNDLGKENIYLGDFDICKRITEYEKELNGDVI